MKIVINENMENKKKIDTYMKDKISKQKSK